jgi:hypothetical protein
LLLGRRRRRKGRVWISAFWEVVECRRVEFGLLVGVGVTSAFGRMMGGWGWKMRGDCGGGRSGVVEEVQGRMMLLGSAIRY